MWDPKSINGGAPKYSVSLISNWLKNHYPDKFKGYGIPEDPASKYLDPASWKCTMIWSAYMGLPLSLESVGAVLKLQDQKMKEGKDLIRYFCSPCKATDPVNCSLSLSFKEPIGSAPRFIYLLSKIFI